MFDLETLEFHKVLDKIEKYAKTPYGKELVGNIVPSDNILEVRPLLNETEEARILTVKYDGLPVGGITDIKNSITKLRLSGVLTAKEILGIAVLLSTTRTVITYFKDAKNDNISYPNLNPYYLALNGLKNLSLYIQTKINEDGLILDTASSALAEIRRKIKNLDGQVRAKMTELLQTKSKMLTDNIIVIRHDRMCLCVKAEFKNTFKGIIHDESASGSTIYIEPTSAYEISNRINGLREEEKDEINRILKEISDTLAANYEEINKNFETISYLDMVFAKAKYAVMEDCYLPDVTDKGVINLKHARHPLIAKEKCVPIDISIGESYKAIIITGPNTGGKTVCLKTTGLLTLMAQSGILIPAEGLINVFDNVFSDIGDEQSIEQSLSSFSSHMVNVIDILHHTDKNSLVLLDELGSGTDPKEGSNLAIAIVEELLSNNSRVIVTTHYADLKAFAYDKKDVINASVEFDINTLRPTYRLLLGVPGRSNAITIASHLGLDNAITNRAKELEETNHTDLSLMLQKLDEENTRLQDEIKGYEANNDNLIAKIKAYEEKEAKLDREYQAYIKKAKAEADKILETARHDAESLLAEIDDIRHRADVKEHEIADIKFLSRTMGIKEENQESLHDFKVGEKVLVKSYNREGFISKVDEKRDRYTVTIGSMNMEFKKKDLQFVSANITPKKPKKPTGVDSVNRQAKLSLDLRGFRYDEVAIELSHFIDQAIVSGIHQIYVIHGFGTGAVRNAVYEYLKKCKYVESTRFGGEGEGLNGCTVVYLK